MPHFMFTSKEDGIPASVIFFFLSYPTSSYCQSSSGYQAQTDKGDRIHVPFQVEWCSLTSNFGIWWQEEQNREKISLDSRKPGMNMMN